VLGAREGLAQCSPLSSLCGMRTSCWLLEEPHSSKEHQVRGIIERFGWEGTLKGHLVQPPAVSRNIFNQIRLLRVPSNLTLNVSSDGTLTTSVGNLSQGFTTLTVKKFFLKSSLNLLFFSLKPLPLVLSLHALVKSPSPAFW